MNKDIELKSNQKKSSTNRADIWNDKYMEWLIK